MNFTLFSPFLRTQGRLVGCLLALFFSLGALAQSPTETIPIDRPPKHEGQNGVARVIPQASFAITNLAGAETSNLGSRAEYGLGVTMDIGSPSAQLVTESGILYRRFGTEINNEQTLITIDVGYIEIPLLAKFYLSPQSSNTLYFKGGIIPGFLAFKQASFTNAADTKNTSQVPLNDVDVQLALGLGGRIRLSAANDLFLEATYNRGLTNVYDSGSTAASPVYNAAFLLTGGLGFNL